MTAMTTDQCNQYLAIENEKDVCTFFKKQLSSINAIFFFIFDLVVLAVISSELRFACYVHKQSKLIN